MPALVNPSVAKYDNNAAVDKAFDVAGSTVYKVSPVAATDPFSGKTNKYAETAAVLVTSSGAGVHVKFGAAAPTADTTNFYIPANVPTVIKIKPGMQYMSVIQAAATAVVYVVELG